MELNADVVRVVVELEDFTALAGLVFANEHEPFRLDDVDKVRIDLVSVAMALIDRVARAVEFTDR